MKIRKFAFFFLYTLDYDTWTVCELHWVYLHLTSLIACSRSCTHSFLLLRHFFLLTHSFDLCFGSFGFLFAMIFAFLFHRKGNSCNTLTNGKRNAHNNTFIRNLSSLKSKKKNYPDWKLLCVNQQCNNEHIQSNKFNRGKRKR